MIGSRSIFMNRDGVLRNLHTLTLELKAHFRRGSGCWSSRARLCGTACHNPEKQRKESRPHRATPCNAFVVCAVWMWQIAIARASAESADWGAQARSSKRVTINCTCSFAARPYPTTELLIFRGAYSTTGSPDTEAASIATPRTWPSFKADLAFAEKKTSSIATTSG